MDPAIERWALMVSSSFPTSDPAYHGLSQPIYPPDSDSGPRILSELMLTVRRGRTCM